MNTGILWQRIRGGIVAIVVVVVSLLAGIAFWQRAEADQQKIYAQKQATAAENARTEAQKQATAAENALTRSFVRTIGVSDDLAMARSDERDALWELAELDAANENVRRMVINRWLENNDIDLLMRPLRNDSRGLHAAIGLNVALTAYWSCRANKASDRLAKALESTPETDADLFSLGETLSALAVRMNPEAAAPLADRLAKALERPETDADPFILGATLSALAARMNPEAAAPLAARGAAVIAKALESTAESDPVRVAVTLKALAARMNPEAAAPLADRLAKALESTPNSDYKRLSSVAETLTALAARMNPEAAAPLADRLAKALESTPKSDSQRLVSLGPILSALAVRMNLEAAAPLADRLAKALESTPNSDSDRLGSLQETLKALAARMNPEAAAPLADRLAKALESTPETDSLRLMSLGESLSALAARFPEGPSTQLLALSNVFLESIPNRREEARVWKTVRTGCAQLRPRDLAEVLKWPFCVGEAQKLVFAELEKKIKEETGRTFDGDVWKFVEQVDSLGINGLDRQFLDQPAKRPKPKEALRDLEELESVKRSGGRAR